MRLFFLTYSIIYIHQLITSKKLLTRLMNRVKSWMDQMVEVQANLKPEDICRASAFTGKTASDLDDRRRLSIRVSKPQLYWLVTR